LCYDDDNIRICICIDYIIIQSRLSQWQLEFSLELWLSSRHLCCSCLKHARAAPFRADPALKAQQLSFPSLLDKRSIYAKAPQHILGFILVFLSLYLFHIMNVRSMIESYEQGRSSTTTRPSPRTSAHRARPRPRPRTPGTDPSLVTASQRSLRTQRPPNLKIVKEERPVTIVLKVS